MCVVNFVLKLQTLADKELEAENVVRLRLEFAGESVDRDGVILSLGR